MAEEEKSNLPVIVIDDQQYLLDYSDITGIEWREIKKITGQNSMEAIAQTSMMDFESLASIVYIFAKRRIRMSNMKRSWENSQSTQSKLKRIWIKLSQKLKGKI